MTELCSGAAALAGRITEGSQLALPADYVGAPVALVRAVIEQKISGLSLVAAPTQGFAADLLIGAGAVEHVEAAAISLGEAGPAPRFQAALRSGTITMTDSTCPAIHAGLQAAEKGVPFIPLRGIIGSDLIAARPDWKIIDNPFEEGDPIILIGAISPEIAAFHAPRADRAGNVWIGRRRELMTLAHAAQRTLVTVEEIVDHDLLETEEDAAGTLPSLYVEAIAVAEGGARPLGLPGCYAPDWPHLKAYGTVAQTEAGFTAYLKEGVARFDAA